MSETLTKAADVLAREAARAESGFEIRGSCEDVVRTVISSIRELPPDIIENGDGMTRPLEDFDFIDIWQAIIDEILK